jgi:hypothetical protein
MRLALGSVPILVADERADWLVGAVIGFAAMADGAVGDAAGAPVELIIGFPG